MTRGGSALGGLRVLEIGGGYSAPFAGRLLADLGAEVIKIENASGDPTRRWGPRLDGESPLEGGALFEFLNWNKASLQLDAEADRSTILKLAAEAGIVLVGDDLDVLAGWGLDIPTIRSVRDDLVLTTVTPFGAFGPDSWWRGSDLVVQAAGGLMAFSGTFDRTPLKRGLRQPSYTSGLTAAYASLAAYLSARRSGRGVHVDVAQQEAVAAELILNAPTYTYMGAIQGRRAASKDPFTGEPIPARDGYVTVQTNTWTTLPMFAELLDEPRLCDERFDTRQKRGFNAGPLTEILTEAMSRLGGRELLERAAKADMLAGFTQTAEQLLTCPQLEARRVFHEVPGTVGPLGPWRFPAVLAEMSETPTRVTRRAPRLGEYGEQAMAGWLTAPTGCAQPSAASKTLAPKTSAPENSAPATLPAPRSAPDELPRPLDGLKVVDLSSVVAVPLMGAMLSDMGASVLKIEAPNRLDQGRGPMFGPLLNNVGKDDPWNRSGAFHSLNRGKRGIALDLKSERGREILLKLIADADVLLENFTPRVMRGWGLTYERLAEINPRLVMLSNNGYGSSGPWSSFKAQGTTLEATMGVGTYCGYENDKPTKVGQSYPDFIACWTGLTMLFAALIRRESSGRGQHVDVGMYQLGASMIPEAFVLAQAGLPDPGRVGNLELGSLLSDVFPSAGDDRWVGVCVPDTSAWHALAKLVAGIPPEPSVDGAPSPALRAQARQALERWTSALDARQAALALQSAGIPAAPVNDARDLLLDAHLHARGMYEDVDLGPEAGVTPVLSRGFRWLSDGSRVTIQFRGPRFAEHNTEVLTELGVDAEAGERLRADGVVVDEPIAPPRLMPFDLVEGVRTHLYREVDADFRERLTRGRAELRAQASSPQSSLPA